MIEKFLHFLVMGACCAAVEFSFCHWRHESLNLSFKNPDVSEQADNGLRTHQDKVRVLTSMSEVKCLQEGLLKGPGDIQLL